MWYPVRRRVRFSRFLGTGALLGFLVGAFFAITGPDTPRAGTGASVAFLGLVGLLLGLLISGLVAVLIDRRL